MHSVGVDIIEIQRIEEALDRWGERFLNHIFTQREVRHFRHQVPELAVRFAGKEAVMKVLGTGRRGVSWREIEILPMRGGKPLVYLHGRARRRADEMGLADIDISLSHSRDFAVAFAIGELE